MAKLSAKNLIVKFRSRRKPSNQVSIVTPAVRDFIYFDSERMESYLAQVERGLRQEESETTSFEKEIGGKLAGGMAALVGAELSASGTHTRQHQVSKRLHSYLCQLLEDRL